jgi:hypothetical protein
MNPEERTRLNLDDRSLPGGNGRASFGLATCDFVAKSTA